MEKIEIILNKVKHGVIPSTLPSVEQHQAIDILEARINLMLAQHEVIGSDVKATLSIIVTSAIGQQHVIGSVPVPRAFVSTPEDVFVAGAYRAACTSIGIFYNDLPNREKFNKAVIAKLKPLIKKLTEASQ